MRQGIQRTRFIRALAVTTLRLLALTLPAIAVLPAQAQNLSTRPIRILVPYGPAGAVDLAPRLIAERMSSDLGVSVVVENKAGGLGMPAINDLMNQPSDGSTVFAADAGHWAIIPAMQAVTYDFMRDFAPIAQTFNVGLIVFTNTQSGITSLSDLIAKAKANPGKLNFSSPGIGTLHHLSMEVMKSALSLDMKHIPFKGAGDALESVLRNDSQFSLATLSVVQPHVAAGKVKLLAVAVPTRVKQIPDVPTVSEITGIKDFSFPGQQGLFVKAGTARPIVDRLNAAVRKAGLAPEVTKKMLDLTASDMVPGTPEQLGELVRADIVKYGNAVKISGAKLQ